MQWALYHDDNVHFAYEAPWWSRVVLLVDLAVLLPLFIIVRACSPLSHSGILSSLASWC